MIKTPESPPDMDENALKFQVTESLQVLQLERGGEQKDPIFELFNPPANSKQGLSCLLCSQRSFTKVFTTSFLQIRLMLSCAMRLLIW